MGPRWCIRGRGGEWGSPPELERAGHFMEEEGKEDQEGCEKSGLEDRFYWQRKFGVELKENQFFGWGGRSVRKDVLNGWIDTPSGLCHMRKFPYNFSRPSATPPLHQLRDCDTCHTIASEKN